MSSSTSMLDVGVVVLTLNEEDNLPGLFSSLAGSGLPVFLVDSGSTDSTLEIARDHGAVVLVHRFDGPFLITDQRNWAVRAVRDRISWAVFLDADERATEEFVDEVRNLPEIDGNDAFYASPMFVYQGTWLKHFMGFPNWHPRVVRTCVDGPFVGGVWEEFHSKLSASYMKEPYLHYANLGGLDRWVKRHLRYATWEAAEEGRGGVRTRRRKVASLANRAGSLRPFASIAYYMLFRRGFLDGGSVWSYLRRQLMYELLIVEAKRERRRAHDGIGEDSPVKVVPGRIGGAVRRGDARR